MKQARVLISDLIKKGICVKGNINNVPFLRLTDRGIDVKYELEALLR